MATPRKIQKLIYGRDKLDYESAQKASEVLQKNHDCYNIFSNKSALHVDHHSTAVSDPKFPALIPCRTILFPPPDCIRSRIATKPNTTLIGSECTLPAFTSYLGIKDHYVNYLELFTLELEHKGLAAVMNEYLFAGTPKADDMLVRLYTGFLHPFIHLGFGLEFAQPAIVAKALALTAPGKQLECIRTEMLYNTTLTSFVQWNDKNKIRDGILARASTDMISLAAQYIVRSMLSLPLKTAEMMNFAAFFTAAAQPPPYEPRIDIFYMNSINSAIFFPKIMEVEYIPDAAKIRLLEWKARTDLTLYGSCGFLELRIEEVVGFTPGA
ncbi:hypothetical protein EJ05DRAFT_513715 [Pseudovirgaria hyperparasitica]|uniref:Uncharacterized protein n=1 Tax=Pseudovirgaria hyperparasitica TaxID=470096 RepID=A0A6A6VY70_9PEZI|nr:uncharacterized protein EJ05DRAFT_513715 [Pseudovirgaria hyperparasitica]KAF2754789.1 hypothetical protein EJ05DRAFT_513715 [Pseudovirgaria hyperparasitica]